MKKLRLIGDSREGKGIERRDHTCLRLYACESDWIVAWGSRQAQCPRNCEDYVPREKEP